MRAVLNYAYLPPAGAIAVVEIPEPAMPDQSEVLVGMDFSHISHDDLQLLSGKHSTLPMLPCVPGCWGVGTVLAIGRDIDHIKIGSRVVLPRNCLTWVERIVVPINDVVTLGRADELRAELGKFMPSTTDSERWHDRRELGDPYSEFVQLLSEASAGAQVIKRPAKVFSLWQINEGIACAVAGFHVFLRISGPLSG